MILYVNGDSHTAAAEARVPHAFAEDDSAFFYMGRAPHPRNLEISWGAQLADRLKLTLKCDAESASSNDRIMRTTRKWAEQYQGHPANVLMVIQWSTWEREEWLIDDVYYQVTASGTDDVPEKAQERYRQWVRDLDWNQKTLQSHEKIWDLHCELKERGLRHLFFNGNNHFGIIEDIRYRLTDRRKDWGVEYLAPYRASETFDSWLKNRGHTTVSPKSYHFGESAHADWANYLLQYIVKNHLI